jgi:DNA-binding NarL/FixJ family response regulator
MSIRILLADDHRIMREGLRSVLEKEPDMEVIAEAKDGRMTVKLAEKLSPDVILMDITMPGLNGMDATREILSMVSDVKVVALSMHSDEQFVAGMLNAGASGYLLKDCAFEELCRAIRAVVANETYLSPGIASIVVKEYRRALSRTEFSLSPGLTAREREVVQLVTEGKSSKEIASLLHVSVRTVESHRHQIMDKLDIHTIAELTKYAIRKGITSLET